MKIREKSRPLRKHEYEKIILHLLTKISNTNHKTRKFAYFRNICIYSTMWYIGARPEEAYASLTSDLDLEAQTFFINGNRNKTRRSRERKIPKPLIALLNKYLQIKTKTFPKNKYLFPASQSKPINRRTLQIDFQRILEQLKLLEIDFIDKRGSPRYTINLYSFRKGHATYLYEETGDPYLVKESLNHKNITTTIKFYIKAMPKKTQNKICEVFN